MGLTKDYIKQPVPYVNIGGTAFADLMNDYSTVRRLILDALDHMQKIGPHPRDYMDYTHYNQARLCYLRNLEVLQAVADEYNRLMEAIDEKYTK